MRCKPGTEKPGETENEPEARPATVSRREFVRRAGKAAYVAPTLTVFAVSPRCVFGASPAPPPPPGNQSENRIRLERSILEQERTRGGPDPLDLFAKPPEDPEG